MLKKVCCGVVVPITSLFLIPFLLVGGMTLLMLLVSLLNFFDPVFVRQNFCPSHFLGECKGLHVFL